MYLLLLSEDIYDIISPTSKFSIIGRPFSITLILLAKLFSSDFVIINCIPVLFSSSANFVDCAGGVGSPSCIVDSLVTFVAFFDNIPLLKLNTVFLPGDANFASCTAFSSTIVLAALYLFL